MSYSIFFHILIIIEPLLQSTQPVFIFLTYWIINVTVHEISKMLCQNLEKLYMYTHIHQQHQQPLYALIGNIFWGFFVSLTLIRQEGFGDVFSDDLRQNLLIHVV